jgi:hypothetical protein
LDLEANRQVIEHSIEDNLENGKEYVGLIETPYQNLMLDRRVLRIEERLVGHMFSTTKSGTTRCMDWGVFKESTTLNNNFHEERCS